MKPLQENKVYQNIWRMIATKDSRGEVLSDDVLECLPAYDSDIIRYSRLYSGENMRIDEIESALRRDSDDSAPLKLTGGYQSTKTTTTNVHVVDGCPIPFSGGFDGGTEISLYGDFFPDSKTSRDLFFDKLDCAKTRARRDAESCAVDLNGRLFLVEPYGVASKSYFGRFKYILKSGGVTLLVNDVVADEAPCVRILYGYDALFNNDLCTVHNETIETLKRSGFVLKEEKLSRVDLQCTLNTPYKLVEYAFANDCVVSRVRKWSQYSSVSNEHLNIGTIRGGQDLQICIYDKQAECQATGNMEKFENCLRASGQDTFHLTRVEYRLRRRVLNAMRIDTVDDLYASLTDLIEFLTGSWFRILNEPKKRGHENDQLLSGFWQCVQVAFREVFCNGKRGNSENITINKIRLIDKQKLTRQGMGCLIQAVASATFRQEELDPKEFLMCITTVIQSRLPEFYDSYKRKREQIKIVRDRVYFDHNQLDRKYKR